MTTPADPKFAFDVGDTVRVTMRPSEEPKAQGTPFEGVVIALRGQAGNKTFTVRKLSSDKVAVERIFPLDSVLIGDIKVVKRGHVRRAKLYYLRQK